MKRLYVSWLITLMTISVYSFDYTYQGVTFNCKIKDKTVCITSFSVKAKHVVVPAVVKDKGIEYKVKSISTFLNGVNYLAETLILEEGIEDIDKFSFNEFRKLVNITLPSTIQHIGRNAFRNNDRMMFNLASNLDEQAIRDGKDYCPVEFTPLSNSVSHSLAMTKEEKQLPKDNPVSLAETSNNKSSKQNEDKKVQPEKNIVNSKQDDVDIDIPVTSIANDNTYCVIIANENYRDVPNVEYANRDGDVFKEYCIKTLCIPEKQIKFFSDATYTDIKRAINWIESISTVTDGNSKIIFYYAGHGIPSEKDKTAFLMPTDGFPKDITTCYKLSDLYSRLGKIHAQSVNVLLDACFSGVERGSDQALVAARGVAIKPKTELLSGNIVVFSATSDEETALSYKEKRHGMFTYFLLKELKDKKGKVKLGDFYSSISSKVKKNSILENDKLQTPSVNVSINMKEKWQDIYF